LNTHNTTDCKHCDVTLLQSRPSIYTSNMEAASII